MNGLRGISLGTWMRILAENRFRIEKQYLDRLFFVTIKSLYVAVNKRRELRKYGSAIANTEIQPPVFIIGHWRSGTTLIHELLGLDDQFAYPNLFEVSHPHTFFTVEKMFQGELATGSSEARPMDNMTVNMHSPGEDESAIAMMSGRSPIIFWSFPHNVDFYDRYHTFETVRQKEFLQWKRNMIWFYKKLTLKYKRPLVLKSPIHTGRIKILLEAFPDAKFIHIYRNPFRVFQSTKNLYKKMLPTTCLQTADLQKWDEIILRDYRIMYDAFFIQKDLIPMNNFYEIRFEDFETDIVAGMRDIYAHLGFQGFTDVKPKIDAYLQARSNFKKNIFKALTKETIQRIESEWKPCLERWNYTMTEIE